jgi:hypothetical protein
VFIFSMACGALLLVLGVITDRAWYGLFGFLWLSGFGALLYFGRGERTELFAEPGDERAKQIDNEAARYAYSAVTVVAVIGFLVEWARGTPGPFTLICAIGGAVHIGSVLWLRNRR